MRRRVAGYITKQSTNEFGLEITVDRQVLPKQDYYPVGDVKQGVVQPPDKGYREVIPPGEFGSEGEAEVIETDPMKIETVAYNREEFRDQAYHGAVHSMHSGAKEPVPFQAYATFQPRSAPLPRNASDELYLEGAGKNVADPRMTDYDSNTNLLPRELPDRVDLYGENRAGVLHNEGHPGFAAVQKKIAQKDGVPMANAGAILASATRKASPAAKKANPALKRVPGVPG